jgi:SAM-dependent methyltransferase
MHRANDPVKISLWINRFAGLIPVSGTVLDLACGGGRHSRFLLAKGHFVLAVDRDTSGLTDLAGNPGLEILTVDLEDGRPWPLTDRKFAGIIVTNYLHRPLLPAIVGAVAPSGCLLYETFAVGNERFGRPSNPAFLLQPGELLDAVAGQLQVAAYENLEIAEPRPAVVQRIAAFRPAHDKADKHLE